MTLLFCILQLQRNIKRIIVDNLIPVIYHILDCLYSLSNHIISSLFDLADISLALDTDHISTLASDMHYLTGEYLAQQFTDIFCLTLHHFITLNLSVCL